MEERYPAVMVESLQTLNTANLPKQGATVRCTEQPIRKEPKGSEVYSVTWERGPSQHCLLCQSPLIRNVPF